MFVIDIKKIVERVSPLPVGSMASNCN